MVKALKQQVERAAHLRTLGAMLLGLVRGIFAVGQQSGRIMSMPVRLHALEVFRADSAALRKDLQSLTVAHASDILRLERKLDCALWDLPRGCRETMAPR